MDLSKLSEEELRTLLKQVRQERLEAKTEKVKATDGMDAWDKGFAGGGKALYDMARGLGQLVGVGSREDFDQVKKQDADLMDTGWGMAGNVAGNVIPALAMPASTLPRALATGAGLGFAQPVGTDDSRVLNAMIGGAAGAAVPAGMAAARGGREPVVAPQRAAARMLQQFADDPQAMRLAIQRAGKSAIPGYERTLAQVVQQPGISSLERGVMNQPGPLQKSMTDRGMQNNAAVANELDDLAGRGGKAEYFKASRETVANELYERAFAEVPGDTKWIKGEVTKLMQRPAFVSALKDAQELALDSGIKVSPKNPENATQLLHFTKMALDDKIEAAVRAGNGNKSRALIDTRDKLVSLMESKDFSPSYREARDTFKNMSGPINEMELAEQLRAKGMPAMADVTGSAPGKLYADGMARELRSLGPQFNRASPEFKGRVGGLMKELEGRARAEGLGKPTGSPTAQYLTTQNLMRQIAGPLGIPAGFAEKTGASLMATPFVGSALQWAGKGSEQRLQQELAEFLLNPANAGKAMDLINRQPGAVGRRAQQAMPYLPALGVSGMFANRREKQ
jgi:hypothetical protein